MAKRKVAKKSAGKLPIKKMIPQSGIHVERKFNENEKIVLGVSKKLSDLTGINVLIIRALFVVSAVLLIGIPVYLILSLVLKD